MATDFLLGWDAGVLCTNGQQRQWGGNSARKMMALRLGQESRGLYLSVLGHWGLRTLANGSHMLGDLSRLRGLRLFRRILNLECVCPSISHSLGMES